jgi:hypothetical protein
LHGWSGTAKLISDIERMSEKGRTSLSHRDTVALAKGLDTTYHWLVTGHGVEGEDVLIKGVTARLVVSPDELAAIRSRHNL